jgi:hypothetical protein
VLALEHGLEDRNGFLIGRIEDMAYSQQINQIVVSALDMQGLFEYAYGLSQAVALEVFVDTLNGALHHRAALGLLLSLEDLVVHLLVVLTGRVVLPTHRLLITGYFLSRTHRLRGGVVLLLTTNGHTSLAESLGWLLFFEGLALGTVEDISVFGKGALVGRDESV